jgi:hypothetical protein
MIFAVLALQTRYFALWNPYKFHLCWCCEEIVDESGKKVTRAWNPIKRIKEYRESGDPVLHLNPPLDFFAKAVAKHNYAMTEYMSEGQLRPHIRKGFDALCE